MTKIPQRRRVGGPTPNRAMRNLLRNFEANNKAERRFTPPGALERQFRELVLRDYPDLPPAEVERRVQRRMEHGQRRYDGPLPMNSSRRRAPRK